MRSSPACPAPRRWLPLPPERGAHAVWLIASALAAAGLVTMTVSDAAWIAWPVVALLLVAFVASEIWTWGMRGFLVMAVAMLAVVVVAFAVQRLS